MYWQEKETHVEARLGEGGARDLLRLPAGGQPPSQSDAHPGRGRFSSHSFGKLGLGHFPITLFFSFNRKRPCGLRHWILFIRVREHCPTVGTPASLPPTQNPFFLKRHSSACSTHFLYRQSLLLSPIKSKEQSLPFHVRPLQSWGRMRY